MGNCVQVKRMDKDEIVTDNQKISFQVSTWEKQSHGLFDYESTLIKQEIIPIIRQENGFLVRIDEQIKWQTSIEEQQDAQIIFELVQNGGQLWIKCQSNEAQEKEQIEEVVDIEDESNFRIQGNQMKSVQSHQILSVSANTMMKSDQQQKEQTEIKQSKQYTFYQSLIKPIKQHKVWAVVQSLQTLSNNADGVPLRVGDIIKLGRIKLRVRDINLFGEESSDVKSLKSDVSSQNSNPLCRFCLSEKVMAGNPMLNPCKCSGTMKYLHLECLQTWLRLKLQSKQNESCTIYLWKDLSCELCKFQYKPIFISDNITYDLAELSKPKGVPYVLLELQSKKLQAYQIMNMGDPFTQKACGIYIVTFSQKKEVNLGRAHDNEVRVSDISVSRFHAKLSLVFYINYLTNKKKNQLMLKDLKSKFGTLILQKENLQITPEINRLQLQMGRSVIKINTESNLTCCFKV